MSGNVVSSLYKICRNIYFPFKKSLFINTWLYLMCGKRLNAPSFVTQFFPKKYWRVVFQSVSFETISTESCLKSVFLTCWILNLRHLKLKSMEMKFHDYQIKLNGLKGRHWRLLWVFKLVIQCTYMYNDVFNVSWGRVRNEGYSQMQSFSSTPLLLDGQDEECLRRSVRCWQRVAVARLYTHHNMPWPHY